MSRSKKRLTNPAIKFVEFRNGQFQYYDRHSEETDKNVILDLPVKFIVLDELSVIKGFCKKTKSGITSNEIRSTKKEVLHVRTFKGGEELTGLYEDIKDSIKALGGKYCKSIYAAWITDEGLEPVNIQLKGAACSAWIGKKFSAEAEGVGVCVQETYSETNGTTRYEVPKFERFQTTPEQEAQAVALDKELQRYLDAYLEAQGEAEILPDIEPEEEEQAELVPAFNKQALMEKEAAREFETAEATRDLPF